MVRTVLNWERSFKKYISLTTGDFNISMSSGHPIVAELIHRLAFDLRFSVHGKHLSWQQYALVPFGVWTDDNLSTFALHLVDIVDQVHERHCLIEMFQSESATMRKLVLSTFN
jgi:hypothetical protein